MSSFEYRIQINKNIRLNELKVEKLNSLIDRLVRERDMAAENVRQLERKFRKIKRRHHANL